MKKITFLTSTRADYGLLAPFIKSSLSISDLKTELVVTGTHLIHKYGYTISEIIKDKLKIDYKINIFNAGFNHSSITSYMANTLEKFSEFFAYSKPNYVALLGDRFEILSIALAAYNLKIPIIHFYGGETTEGANDEAYRHAISKLSYLHFTSTEYYRKRVIQLGEHPSTVYNIGAIGIENINNAKTLSIKELSLLLGINLVKPYAVVTYHPETLGDIHPKEQIKTILSACSSIKEINFIFTKSNIDTGGYEINSYLEKNISLNANCFLFDSLGVENYLSLVSNASFVLGNSSSGLIEVPSFKIATINVGDRQKGRLQAKSVVNSKLDEKSIIDAIYFVLSRPKNFYNNVINPYGDGNTTKKFLEVFKKEIKKNSVTIKKKFYDYEVWL
jgi:GDP/UDP-N,N'-diacetylbacillosamine 2-epimerase (hydrolysing)